MDFAVVGQQRPVVAIQRRRIGRPAWRQCRAGDHQPMCTRDLGDLGK
jgi:hypothetical protein